MNRIATLLCLAVLTAGAQQPTAPASGTPADPTLPTTTKPVDGHTRRADKKIRKQQMVVEARQQQKVEKDSKAKAKDKLKQMQQQDKAERAANKGAN